jgi:hypothetical protein
MRVINSSANDFIMVKVSQRTTSETDCRFADDSDTENRISAKLLGEGYTAVDATIVEPDKTPNPHNLLPKPELLPRVILTLWRLRSLDKRRDQLAISWTDRPIPNGLEEGRRETDCSTPQ